MPSFELQADIFTCLSVLDSPKGSSNTFKTHKISACISKEGTLQNIFCIEINMGTVNSTLKKTSIDCIVKFVNSKESPASGSMKAKSLLLDLLL